MKLLQALDSPGGRDLILLMLLLIGVGMSPFDKIQGNKLIDTAGIALIALANPAGRKTDGNANKDSQ